MNEKHARRFRHHVGEPSRPSEPLPKPKEIAPPTQVKLGGGIVITSAASPEGTPAASQLFLFWVVNSISAASSRAIRRAS